MAVVLYAGEVSVPEFVKQTSAVKINEHIIIDGKLQEKSWQRRGISEFYQSEPNQGEPASLKSEVWLAYDDNNFYVAAKLYDNHPDSIDVRLGRRDVSYLTDEFDVYFDSYHDKRTGFYFCVTAGGTVHDGILLNDDWLDYTWDGVWEAKTDIQSDGWSVEIKIPFSQLRFTKQDNMVWGVNFERDIRRKHERSLLVYTPRNESGFVSRFAELNGLTNIQPPARVELLPYINNRQEYSAHAPGDPFNNGSKHEIGIGFDTKLGIGSNLIFDGTVNPDFGQVEVDPAVVNLSDVETYFDEKRPFFKEGVNIFQYGNGGATNYWNFNWPGPTMFYSRRIGRSPQGSLPDYDYADVPLGTHIIGAGKITGKIANDWNFGTIHGITRREFANLDTSGHHFNYEVEPLTYYGIIRAQRDFNNGRQGFGILSTYTNRFFSNDALRNDLNKSSLLAAFDGWTYLDGEKYFVLTGAGSFSNVQGSTGRLISLQRNSTHYYQRPDAKTVHIDSSATSLSGYSTRFTLQKQKGALVVNSALGIISPGYEINDLGFETRSDVINYHLGLGYKWNTPTDYYRYITVIGAYATNFNFDGISTFKYFYQETDFQLPNYYSMSLTLSYRLQGLSDRSTRGGPMMGYPSRSAGDFSISSDDRAWWTLNLSTGYAVGGGNSVYVNPSIELKPSANVTFSIGPNYSHDMIETQWVTKNSDATATDTYGNRYIFSYLNQHTLSADIRVNWMLTPTLSFQLFMQPLISSGHYYGFKELSRPGSSEYLYYGSGASTISSTVDNDGNKGYSVDPDGSGQAPSFSFNNPDFNYTSLRGNAVLRWEYLPGSNIYFVWTQNRANDENVGDFQFKHSLTNLMDVHPDNIFMIKISYWLNVR